MTELKPCPFCGGEVTLYVGTWKHIYWKHKEKRGLDCIMITPNKIHGAKCLNDGYERWNRRADNDNNLR